jgi:hypothetical protein
MSCSIEMGSWGLVAGLVRITQYKYMVTEERSQP